MTSLRDDYAQMPTGPPDFARLLAILEQALANGS
jgi:hypothetical protein